MKTILPWKHPRIISRDRRKTMIYLLLILFWLLNKRVHPVQPFSLWIPANRYEMWSKYYTKTETGPCASNCSLLCDLLCRVHQLKHMAIDWPVSSTSTWKAWSTLSFFYKNCIPNKSCIKQDNVGLWQTDRQTGRHICSAARYDISWNIGKRSNYLSMEYSLFWRKTHE